MSMISQVNEYIDVKASRNGSVHVPTGVTVPEHEEGTKCPVVVMLHGFLGSKDEEFGFYANPDGTDYGYPSIAEELLKEGIGTIRIDQPGHGDSQDAFVNYTLTNCVSDMQDAYDFCIANYDLDPEHVALVGWSMGGKVGPIFVDNNENVHTVVYLNPAGDNGNNSLITAKEAGIDWTKLEVAAVQSGTVFNEGAHDQGKEDATMSYEYFRQIDESNTGELTKTFTSRDGNNGLLIYGDVDCVINPTTYAWMRENSGLKYVCIPGMDHDLGLETDRPDYTNIVIDLTVSFINRHI